jgi:predicted phosphoribosyltransferase
LLGRAGGRRVRDSAGLDAAERRANLAGRFRPLPAAVPDDARLVLVDDVVTSGATLTEAARELRTAHDTPVLAAVVAATPRRPAHPVTRVSPGAFTVRGAGGSGSSAAPLSGPPQGV